MKNKKIVDNQIEFSLQKDALELCEDICNNFDEKMTGKTPKVSMYNIWKKAESLRDKIIKG